MLDQLEVRLKLSFWLHVCILCCMLLFLININCFGQKRKKLPTDEARNFIISEKINDAIVSYALLAKGRSDPTWIAEYAYALALGGIYDAALIQLDRIWFIGNYSTDVNYFAGQVFALMGYDNITNEIWKSSEKFKTPEWIASKAPILLEKYKAKASISSIKNRKELINNFNRANELASQHLYLQSITLFQEIIQVYPNEFLPLVYYSITLEKTGANAKAAQLLEQAISLIGNNPEDQEKKQLLDQRLSYLRSKVNMETGTQLVTFPKNNVLSTPHIMAFIGGQSSSSFTNVNFKIGYLFSDKFNTTLNLGVMDYKGETNDTYMNFGLTAYGRIRLSNKNTENPNYLVGGIGISKITGTDVTPYFSFGFSKMFKTNDRAASLDIIINTNLKKLTSISLGDTFYF